MQQQVLEELLAGMPEVARPGMHGATLVSTEWRDGEGLLMKWDVNLAGVVSIPLEHTVALDCRDLQYAALNTALGGKHHEVRERLSALEWCAIQSELEGGVEGFRCKGDE